MFKYRFKDVKSRGMFFVPREGEILLSEGEERVSDFGVVLDEMTIEIAEAKEALGFFEVTWDRPICDCLYFGRVHFDLAMGDDDTEVLDRGLVEKTFLGFEVQIKFEEMVEDFMGEFVECGKIVMKKEDVIEVNDKVTLVDKVLEDMGHKGLKCGRGIAKAEGHDEGFEETELAFEGGFPFITLFDVDVIVTPMDIEFGKVM